MKCQELCNHIPLPGPMSYCSLATPAGSGCGASSWNLGRCLVSMIQLVFFQKSHQVQGPHGFHIPVKMIEHIERHGMDGLPSTSNKHGLDGITSLLLPPSYGCLYVCNQSKCNSPPGILVSKHPIFAKTSPLNHIESTFSVCKHPAK